MAYCLVKQSYLIGLLLLSSYIYSAALNREKVTGNSKRNEPEDDRPISVIMANDAEDGTRFPIFPKKTVESDLNFTSSTGSTVEEHDVSGQQIAIPDRENGSDQGVKNKDVNVLTNRMTMMESGSTKEDIKFIEKEQPRLKNLKLKHFNLYEDLGFYPAWTYDGFYPPKAWHKVDIYYFIYPSRKEDQRFNTNSNVPTPAEGPLERHKSSMALCNDRVLAVIPKIQPPFSSKQEQCWRIMQNECMNSLPSPIDIDTKAAKMDDYLEDIDFTNYDHVYQFRMALPDDGTDLLTLQFIAHENEKPPGIKVRGDRILYLDRIIFRVGFKREKGSEHTIDGKSSGMELQLFFTPENLTYWEALAQYQLMKDDDPRIGQNVYAVSVLVNVTKESKVDPTEAEVEYAKIFEILSQGAEKFWKSRNPKRWRAIKFSKNLISLENILRLPLKGPYYVYEGSMTNPPCLPHLMWIVFENPIWITFNQWKRFVLVHSEYSDDKYLAGNFRPFASIFVKVNLESFTEMKKANGQGKIEQVEIDRALKDHQRILKNEPIVFTASYEKYRKYFATKVLRSTNGVKDGNELNYYE